MILFKRVGESFGRIEGREWALLFLETLGVVAGILVAFWLMSGRRAAMLQPSAIEANAFNKPFRLPRFIRRIIEGILQRRRTHINY